LGKVKSMYKKTIAILMVLSTFCTTGVTAQNWYKGNLHTHTIWSDGDEYPEMVIDWYKSRGYDFIGLSDHNKVQEGSVWINIPRKTIDREAFNNYLSKYGDKWVEFKKWDNDSIRVRLKTLEECRQLFEEKGKFFIFKNEEITSNFNGKPVHINATNIQKVIPRQYGNSIVDVIQKSVNMVAEQRSETGQKMFAQVNHPNFGLAITAADIMQVQNVRFFEVFNGGPMTNNYGDAFHDSTEVMWDKINLHYLKQGRPLILGLAVDDSHSFHVLNSSLNNPGRAWVMVYAPKLDPNLILESLEAGKFYSTTGVLLKELYYGSKKISLQIKIEEGIFYKIQFIGIRKGMAKAEILKEVAGIKASYKLTDKDLFVRVRIISSKQKLNPFRPGDVETAWTQPVVRN
jgi:hypothetical protein